MSLGALIPAAISGIGSIIGGVVQGNAAGDAAAAQQAAAQKAIEQEQGAVTGAQAGVATGLANTTANINPYLATGQTGLGMLNAATAPGGTLAQQFSFDPSQIAQNPAYQFQLQQGLLALDRSAAARGISSSGGTAKAIQDYAQSLAGTSYNNLFNQALTTYGTNRNTNLGNIQAMLQQGNFGTQLNQQAQLWAGSTSGQFGMQGAQAIGQDITGAGNAQAAGIIGQGNAMSGMIGGVANAGMAGALASQQPQYPPGFTPYSQGNSFTMPQYPTQAPISIPQPPPVSGIPLAGMPPGIGTGIPNSPMAYGNSMAGGL